MTQKIEITGHDFEVTDNIRDYVVKKLAKLDRYLSTVEDARVDIAHSKSARSAADRYVAQMTVRGKGLLLRAEERADDVRAAIDTALDKLLRQVMRFKGKKQQVRGDGKSVAEVAMDVDPEILADLEKEEPISIVRRKQFDLIPMDEMEAVDQMKLLGHDNFFVFFNAKSSSIGVLYRRRDGTYGLIEPRVR